MNQWLDIKLLREGHHKVKEITEKLVRHFDTEALIYLEVCYGMHELARDREQVEEVRESGRTFEFIYHSRIRAVREEVPNASVRQLAKIAHYSP
jgi:hypothetical protein